MSSKQCLKLFVGVTTAILLAAAVIATVTYFTGRDDKGDGQSYSNGGQNGSDAGQEVQDGSVVVTPTASVIVAPTAAPSIMPSLLPSNQPSDFFSESLFFVIADLPYDESEMRDMPGLIATVPDDALFLVHLGDVIPSDGECNNSTLQEVAEILKESTVPVFMIIGDNEYNDCNNPEEALGLWRAIFSRFDQFWMHDLNVTTMEERSESFTFVNRGTLFIGLNIVGGSPFSNDEWDDRLTTQQEWTINLIEEHRTGDNAVGAVVIFAHANPNGQHDPFFNPISDYIENVLNNSIPIIYMCGDVHSYLYESDFYGQPSFLRVRKDGGTNEPPLMVVSHPTVGVNTSTSDVFDVIRFWNNDTGDNV